MQSHVTHFSPQTCTRGSTRNNLPLTLASRRTYTNVNDSNRATDGSTTLDGTVSDLKSSKSLGLSRLCVHVGASLDRWFEYPIVKIGAVFFSAIGLVASILTVLSYIGVNYVSNECETDPGPSTPFTWPPPEATSTKVAKSLATTCGGLQDSVESFLGEVKAGERVGCQSQGAGFWCVCPNGGTWSGPYKDLFFRADN